MSRLIRTTAAALAVCLLGLGAACGGSPLGSGKPDAQATVHSYQAQGFSIAYGPQWNAAQQNVSNGSSTLTIGSSGSSPSPSPQSSPASGGSTSWQLALARPASDAPGVLEVFVLVTPQTYGDPSVWLSRSEQMLKVFGGTAQHFTLNGVPAIYWQGVTGDNVALATRAHAYMLHAYVPSGVPSTDRARERAILASFKVLGAQ
jgi:hypothetical protein